MSDDFSLDDPPELAAIPIQSEAPAPEAPPAAPSPPPPPAGKRGRGRPPGKRDAAPRTKRAPSPARPAGVAPAAPFGGAVDGEQGPATGAPPRQASPAVAAALIALPAEQLAPVLVAVVEGLAVRAAALRYGSRAAENNVPLSKDERAVIEPLAVEWLRQQTATLTPGDALALALLGMVAGRVAILETDRRQSRPVAA